MCLLKKRHREVPVKIESFYHTCEYIAEILWQQMHPLCSLKGIFKEKDTEIDSILDDIYNAQVRLRKLIADCKENSQDTSLPNGE